MFALGLEVKGRSRALIGHNILLVLVIDRYCLNLHGLPFCQVTFSPWIHILLREKGLDNNLESAKDRRDST